MNRQKRSEYSRGGFALVELLAAVVIGLLVVVIAAPGFLRLRSAARRVECEKNLVTLGKGVNAFETAHSHLPRAGHWDPIYGGWTAELLPYLDVGDLAKQYDYTRNWYDPENQKVVQVPVPLFLCPASPEAKPVGPLKIMGEIHPEKFAAAGDYMVPRGYLDERLPPGKQLGALGWFNEIPRRSQITDGFGTTILISEQAARWGHFQNGKRLPDNKDQTYGSWVGAWASYNAMWIRTSRRGGAGGESGATDATTCGVNCNNSDGFYSFHENGVNALMCDGAVRFLKSTIDDMALYALISRAGNEVIGEGEF